MKLNLTYQAESEVEMIVNTVSVPRVGQLSISTAGSGVIESLF